MVFVDLTGIENCIAVSAETLLQSVLSSSVYCKAFNSAKLFALASADVFSLQSDID